MKKYRNRYQLIKEIVPYNKCIVDVLPNLNRTFSFQEFVEQFLLVFSNLKLDIINSLGMKKFKWWLRRYYLPKVAHKCKDYSFSKSQTLRWTANSNHTDLKISFNIAKFW